MVEAEATFGCHAYDRRHDLSALGRGARPRGRLFIRADLPIPAVAHLARMDERQAIVDLVRAARQQGRGKNWNAGYEAAIAAIIRAAVERGQGP